MKKGECNITMEERRKGGRVTGARRRAAALQRLDGMTKTQVARDYYIKGYAAGQRAYQRRLLGHAA